MKLDKLVTNKNSASQKINKQLIVFVKSNVIVKKK